MEENNKKTLKKELEEIFFEVYGKENFEIYYKINEEKAESNKENTIKKIDNLRKKLIKEMDVVINDSNQKVFTLICKAYFNEEIVIKNDSTQKDISFKTILDEITKDKVKQDNFDESYLNLLWMNYLHIKEKLSQEHRYPELEKMINLVRSNFKHINLSLECISKYSFENFYDSQTEILKTILYSHKESLKIKFNFKEIKKKDLLERLVIFIIMKHYQRDIQHIIKELNHEHSYAKEEKARYIIPKKEAFTLREIAEIYCESSQYKTDKDIEKKYSLLRKIVNEVAISELHKESKSYSIPQSRVINYLSELEVREMNDRKTPAKAINKEDADNLKNGKEVDFNLFNFQRLANSIYARETNRVKINNIIRNFQIEVYTDFINSLNTKELF